MPILIADQQDPNDSLTPENISIERLATILDSVTHSTDAASSLNAAASSYDQDILEITLTGPEFQRPILDGNPIVVNLQFNDRFLYMYYLSGLDPVEFYSKAFDDDSWPSKLVVPSPVWGWLNKINEKLFCTKLVVSDLGNDDDVDLQFVLSKEIFFERGLLERGFVGEVINFYHDILYFFDNIEEALVESSVDSDG
jgi:hypothetical protein